MQESEARDLGMQRSATRNKEWLIYFRALAKYIAVNRADRMCSIEDIRKYCDDNKIKFESGNWIGSVFKTNEWTPTDQRVQAIHRGGHCREVRVWKLV